MTAPEAGPLVSIVTPTFGQGRFIEQTIASIRAQTYPRIEHIVVDGGSADETLDVLRRHESEYDLRWISEPDRGMYDAVNKGLAMARGDVFAYLNSDDLYFPWSVERAVAALSGEPAAHLVYGDALLVDDETRGQRILFQPPYRLPYLLTIGSFAQPATFWRREVTETIGPFDPNLGYTGDLDFFIRAAARYGARRIDEVLAIMRHHGAMKTVTGAGASALENAAVRRRYAPAPSRARLVRERARAWLARRRLLVRFGRAAARSQDSARPWPEFLEAAGVAMSPVDVAVALVPRLGSAPAGRLLRGAPDWLAGEGWAMSLGTRTAAGEVADRMTAPPRKT